ncbi:WD repeat-containing protein DWA1 [Platanthera zijinensis]|uniref:WD repeat-containing protein DWA1 n=1 Tax=Platanthera zijinensis TaxID=2320716 RepID=A0AAP0B057_9ASPA
MLCSKKVIRKAAPEFLSIAPLYSIQAHKGPSYDLKFYGDNEDPLLLSCGDDGCIRGWKWVEVLIAADQGSSERLNPILELVNPQKEDVSFNCSLIGAFLL